MICWYLGVCSTGQSPVGWHAGTMQRLRSALVLVVTLVLTLGLVGCGVFHRSTKEPETDQASLEKARQMDSIEQLINRGRYDAAQRELDGALSGGFEHPRAFFLQGTLYLERGDEEAAIPFLEKTIAASPRWAEPRLRLASAYLALDRLAAAESVFRDIDTLLPWHPAGAYGMGWVMLLRGKDDRARELLDESLERDRRYAPALKARAALAKKDGDDALRERLLEAYVAIVPQDAEAYEQLGHIAETRGLLETADRRFRRAYALGPNRKRARLIADLAKRRGDAQAANLWLQRAGGA